MKTIVNVHTLIMVCVFAVLAHLVTPLIEETHPLLALLLWMLESLGWFMALVILVAFLLKSIKRRGQHAWRVLYKRFSMKRVQDTYVPLEQLTHLQNTVQRLGLALHGMSPEMEQARRTHFQMHGEAVPPLILPLENTTLYAEFMNLVRFLSHFGFPDLESVRLKPEHYQLAQKWASDLAARLLQSQKQAQKQSLALNTDLAAAQHAFASIGQCYPAAQNEYGYHRIQGALVVLQTLADNRHLSCDAIRTCIAALTRDMDTLLKQLKQPVA